MKKILLASTLALCVTSAFAADPTAVLKLQGTLTNASCTPTLSNGGIIDYGTWRLGEMSADEVNQLGHKNFDLSINCTAKTKVGFWVADDRSKSDSGIKILNARANGGYVAGQTPGYGLGMTAGDVKIGSFAIYAETDSILADGVAVSYTSSSNQGATWTNEDLTGGVTPLGFYYYTVAEKGLSDPLAFKDVTIPMVVAAAVDSTRKLAITDDTVMDGQATFTIVYL